MPADVQNLVSYSISKRVFDCLRNRKGYKSLFFSRNPWNLAPIMFLASPRNESEKTGL